MSEQQIRKYHEEKKALEEYCKELEIIAKAALRNLAAHYTMLRDMTEKPEEYFMLQALCKDLI